MKTDHQTSPQLSLELLDWDAGLSNATPMEVREVAPSRENSPENLTSEHANQGTEEQIRTDHESPASDQLRDESQGNNSPENLPAPKNCYEKPSELHLPTNEQSKVEPNSPEKITVTEQGTSMQQERSTKGKTEYANELNVKEGTMRLEGRADLGDCGKIRRAVGKGRRFHTMQEAFKAIIQAGVVSLNLE